MPDARKARVGGLRGGLAALAAVAVAASGCAAARPTRAPRAGVLRDARGRAYFELRRVGALGCHDAARGPATEGEMAERLSASAQAQGYSGVVDVACAPQVFQGCATGVYCTALAVRYVLPSAGEAEPRAPRSATPCVPACPGSATCQDGQCVASCEPPCGAGFVCGPDALCARASDVLSEPRPSGGAASAGARAGSEVR